MFIVNQDGFGQVSSTTNTSTHNRSLRPPLTPLSALESQSHPLFQIPSSTPGPLVRCKSQLKIKCTTQNLILPPYHAPILNYSLRNPLFLQERDVKHGFGTRKGDMQTPTGQNTYKTEHLQDITPTGHNTYRTEHLQNRTSTGQNTYRWGSLYTTRVRVAEGRTPNHPFWIGSGSWKCNTNIYSFPGVSGSSLITIVIGV